MNEGPASCPRCGTSLAGHSALGQLCPRCLIELTLNTSADADDAPGLVFGAYRLVEKIGEGGMGIVWLARQEHPIRRDVAIKVVKPGADSAQVLSRFDSERQALAILNHPNIATVFDAGLTDDGRPFFAMEYVPGLPITAFADQRALPIADRLRLFLEVCEAVAHAHQKGVVHRDLKPANILVGDRDGRTTVKVIDFGVAKALGPAPLASEALTTQIGLLVGTPEYMSPEQAGVTQAAVDTRTDIYSLGLVLYELLAGALPFDAGELRRKALLEMLRVIREDEPPRLASRLTSRTDAEVREIARRRLTEPRTLVRQLRGDLEWITNRALEKEPARRYASASELGTDVRRHLANEPVSAGPPDLRYRLGKLIRRHRAGAIAAGVALAALIAAAVVSSLMWFRAEGARADTRRELAASMIASGFARIDAWDWAGGVLWFVKALEIEPDPARQREHRVRIGQVLQRMPRLARLWSHGPRIKSLDVSAQGIVASAGTDGVVRLWSLATGQPIGAPLKHEGVINRVTFSPDGRLLASASEDGTARLWRASDGAPVGPPLRHLRAVRDVTFSPDSLVVATAGSDGWAKLWRVAGGQSFVEVNLELPVVRVMFTKDGTRFAAAAEERDQNPFAVRLWSAEDGAPAGEWIRGGSPEWLLSDVDLSPDGAHVVTSGRQVCYCARLWDAVTGKPVGKPLEHRNTVPIVRFIAAGTRVVTAGFDRVVQVWSVPAGEPTAPPWTMSGWPEAMTYAVDGQLLLSTVSGAVEIVAPSNSLARENSRLFPTLTHAGPVTSAVMDRSGRFVVTGSADGGVRVWDLSPAILAEPSYAWYASQWVSGVVFFDRDERVAASARVFDTRSGLPVVPPLRVETLDFEIDVTSDGRHIVTSGAQLARVWDAATGEPVSPVISHLGSVSSATNTIFSPDSTKLLTLRGVDGRGEAALWDIATGARIFSLAHAGAVTAGGFSTDGKWLLTASTERDTNVRVWDAASGTLIMSGRHPEGVHSALFDDIGRRIYSVGFDQRVLEWQLGSALASREAFHLQSEPTFLTISRRGTLVAGGRGGEVHARNLRADGGATTDVTHSSAVMGADVSPDEKWIVATGDDGRTNVWNRSSGERVSPGFRVSGPSYGVRFALDGTRVAIGGSGVRIGEMRSDDRPVAHLRDVAELLSTRRLVDASERPLPLEELSARWNRVVAAEPQELERAAPEWNRREAARALSRGDATGALEHLASLRSASPLAWTDTMLLLAALATGGRWSDAAQETERIGARDAAPELSFVAAVSRVRAGDPAAARTVCAELLGRHASTRNPDRALWILRTCLLDPETATQPAWNAAGSLLASLVDLQRYGTRDSLTGAVAVRSGRFAEAVTLLERASAAGEATPHTSLFLALALARSNRTADARQRLLESEKFPWPGANMFSQQAFRKAWFEAEAVILREEVRRAIDSAAGPSRR
jgi:WD40 repeat protein/serine/threonine protein kinase